MNMLFIGGKADGRRMNVPTPLRKTFQVAIRPDWSKMEYSITGASFDDFSKVSAHVEVYHLARFSSGYAYLADGINGDEAMRLLIQNYNPDPRGINKS